MSYPPYGQPVTPRRAMPWWAIVLLCLAGCGVFALAAVAVLAAMLFPVFAQAREAARRASCTANQKQLAMGVLMYAEDYDEKLPPAKAWGSSIDPYVKSSLVYRCPSRPDTPYGYAYNQLMDRRALKDIAAPAQAPVLFESSLGTPNATDQLQSWVAPHPRSGVSLGVVSYADGHVKAVSTVPRANAGLPTRKIK